MRSLLDNSSFIFSLSAIIRLSNLFSFVEINVIYLSQKHKSDKVGINFSPRTHFCIHPEQPLMAIENLNLLYEDLPIGGTYYMGF